MKLVRLWEIGPLLGLQIYLRAASRPPMESSSDNEDKIQISKGPDFDNDVSLIGQEDLIESSLSSTRTP